MDKDERINFNSDGLRGRLRSRTSYYNEKRLVQPYTPRRITDISCIRPEVRSKANTTQQIITEPVLRTNTAVYSNPDQLQTDNNRGSGWRKNLIANLKKINRPIVMLQSAVVIIVVFGVAISLMSFSTDRKVQANASLLTQKSTDNNNSSNLPSEDLPDSNLNNYQVVPDLPRIISIPKIGVKARVVRTGVSTSNELKAPNNIFDTGWYDGSSKPGEAGVMLIDGHLHGPTKSGVFSELKSLTPNDKLTIEGGDGKVFNYQVVKLENVPVSSLDVGAALTTAVPGKNGLNLITSPGPFNKQKNEYEYRLIVYTIQTDSFLSY